MHICEKAIDRHSVCISVSFCHQISCADDDADFGVNFCVNDGCVCMRTFDSLKLRQRQPP